MKVQMLPKREVTIKCTDTEWYVIRQALRACNSLNDEKRILGISKEEKTTLKSLVEDTDIEVIKEEQ